MITVVASKADPGAVVVLVVVSGNTAAASSAKLGCNGLNKGETDVAESKDKSNCLRLTDSRFRSKREFEVLRGLLLRCAEGAVVWKGRVLGTDTPRRSVSSDAFRKPTRNAGPMADPMP